MSTFAKAKNFLYTVFHGRMAELVYAHALGACSERIEGSSPSSPTRAGYFITTNIVIYCAYMWHKNGLLFVIFCALALAFLGLFLLTSPTAEEKLEHFRQPVLQNE